MGSHFVTAHVGYTGSERDYERVVQTEEHLCRILGVDEVDLLKHGDFVDLGGGRDFLSETKTYDIVVLHFVWNDRYGRAVPAQEHPALSTSGKNSPVAWRDRIAASGAAHVFAYGGGSEVTGYYVSEIPGYGMVLGNGGPWTGGERTVYTRKTVEQTA